MSEAQTDNEFFVQQITLHQNQLYAYIYSLLGDHNRAADVLQETNLVLWRRMADFDRGRSFFSWAVGIAKYQVLASLRDGSRDKLLLNEELVNTLSAAAESQAETADQTLQQLQQCLEKLAPASRRMLDLKYFQSQSIAEIAENVGRSVSAVKVALLRSRRQLAECLQRSPAPEAGT